MSIKDGSGQAQTTQDDTSNGAPQQSSRSSSRQEDNGRGFSFNGLSKLTRTAFNRKPSSEALTKIKKVFTDTLAEKGDTSFEITLIPIEKEQTQSLNVSLLVVAVRDKQNLNFGVAYHTLLLEATAQIPVGKTQQIGSINVEVLKTVGDFCNDTLKSTVRGFVERTFINETLRNAGACVVPKNLNLDDAEAVHVLLGNTIFSCTSELETCNLNKNFVDINLINAHQDTTLTVRTQFGQPAELDAVGQPLRADIVIEFQAQQAQVQQSENERVAPISHTCAYVDIFWDPQGPANNPYGFNDNTQQSWQRYGARVVVTAMESTEILTIPAQLLALLPAISLREGNAWIQAFRSKDFQTEGGNMHDIGAIGYEVNFEQNANNIGKMIDTRADKFSSEQLGQLIKATFRPGLTVSLDVPECGPSTWYNEVFSAAAGGNARANSAIIEAANELTGGLFGKYFSPTGRVATDEFNRIHNGTYINARGEVADLRDIDYLAVLNQVGNQDPTAIRLWSDSYAATNIELAKRLADRKRIIQNICNNPEFTGFSSRVTFEADFIEALAKGCQEAGLVVKPISGYHDMGQFERARSQFSSSTVMSSNATGVFRSGNQQWNNAQGTGRQQYSRW